VSNKVARCQCKSGHKSPTGNNKNCVLLGHDLLPQPTCTPNYCGKFSTCDDSSGTAICSCPAGWVSLSGDGTNCRVANGQAAKALYAAQETTCGPNSCGKFGVCDDSSGAPVCSCIDGWISETQDGRNCYPLKGPRGKAIALSQKVCTLTCGKYAVCDASTGTQKCVCLSGWVSMSNDGENCRYGKGVKKISQSTVSPSGDSTPAALSTQPADSTVAGP